MTYVPQVGDRVRAIHWKPESWIDVKCISGEYLIGIAATGKPFHSRVDNWDGQPWIKVAPRPELPEMPERWAVIHDNPHARHASLPYYKSPQDARASQVTCREKHPDHPPDLAYVRYVPDLDSVVWADEVES